MQEMIENLNAIHAKRIPKALFQLLSPQAQKLYEIDKKFYVARLLVLQAVTGNYEFLHKRNLLFGTPDYVIEKINELKSELNLKNLLVWSNFPGVKHEDCMRSIKLFNDEVIPKINLENSSIQRAS